MLSIHPIHSSRHRACRCARYASFEKIGGVAQFDVHRLKSGPGLVIDCQSDLLADLNTRFVVPMIPEEDAPRPAQRLNPIFAIANRQHVMLTQFAAAVQLGELGERVESLRDRAFEIMGALDVLLTGV
jgi:toxin CcdB